MILKRCVPFLVNENMNKAKGMSKLKLIPHSTKDLSVICVEIIIM